MCLNKVDKRHIWYFRSLNSERTCVHRNLCFAITAAQLLFLTGIKAVQIKVKRYISVQIKNHVSNIYVPLSVD